MSAAHDLSGRWQGMFSYPDGAETTAFTTELTDAGGALSGRIIEPNLFSPSLAVIEAVLDGLCNGSAVRFTKFYDDPAGNYDAVFYSGIVDGTGGEIAGWWDISGCWSGTFVMIRDVSHAMHEAEKTADEVR